MENKQDKGRKRDAAASQSRPSALVGYNRKGNER